MFYAKRYQEIGYSDRLIGLVAEIPEAQRIDWYMVASASNTGNKTARRLVAAKFGSARTTTCNAVMRMCYDSIPIKQRGRIYHETDAAIERISAVVKLADQDAAHDKGAVTPRLLTYRITAGMTQQQLSDASGVTVMQISKIERGKIQMGNVTLANAVALGKALGVSAEDLL